MTVTPHDAAYFYKALWDRDTYPVKHPQLLSKSTKATPMKPSTFRIRLGFFRRKKYFLS